MSRLPPAKIIPMNDAQLNDLKQFITGKVSQTESHLSERIGRLEKKMDEGFAGVGEAIEVVIAHIDSSPTVVNQRLTNLEHRAS